MSGSQFSSARLEYAALWANIFRDEQYENTPFQCASWSIVPLVEGIFMEQSLWQGLQVLLEERGSHSVFLTCGNGADGRAVCWTEASLDSSLDRVRMTLSAHDTLYLFDESCEWGMICTTAGFSMLGGIGAIVHRFIELAGGPEKLRAEFHAWTKSEAWFVPSYVTEQIMKLAAWDR